MRYNKTITFQEKTETKDDGGDLVGSWSNVTGLISVPCIVDDVNSSERIIAERNGHLVTMRVYMDYNSSVTKEMRVVFNSTNYTITDVRNTNHLDRKLELDIYEV